MFAVKGFEMLFSLKGKPGKGLDFSFGADTTWQQQFVMPVSHKIHQSPALALLQQHSHASKESEPGEEFLPYHLFHSFLPLLSHEGNEVRYLPVRF